MLGAILAAVSGVEAAVSTGKSIFAGLSGTDAKDPARIAAAQSALDKALAGDVSQLLYMQQQAGQIAGFGSATAVGKEAFRRALVAYDAAKGTHYNLAGTVTVSPNAPTPVQSIVQQTGNQIRQDLASGAQQLLTGATNKVTNAISPNAGTSIPFTQNQLYLAGVLLVVGVIFLPKLLKHHG